MVQSDLFYLSSVYTATTKADQERNYQNVIVAAAMLIGRGIMIYSPIVHNHHLSTVRNCGTAWEDWKDHDLTTLRHCDGLFILVSENWERSVGVMAELRWAIINNIPYWPIYFVDDYIGIWHDKVMSEANQQNVHKLMAKWKGEQPIFRIQEGNK